MSKKTRNIIIAVAVLLVLVVGALLAWNHFKPAAQVGAKTIVLEVVHGDASTKSFSIQTDAENLRACMWRPWTARRPTWTTRSGGASPRAARC